MNFSKRVKHLEERLGMKCPRYVLTIICSDKTQRLDPDRFGCTEINPGVYAFAWDGELTNTEIEELRARKTCEINA
jgi:hypothetical protein